jgi:hypothetical protein
MAEEIGYTLGPKAIEQIRQLIRESRSQYQNPEGHRARWMRTPQPKSGGTASPHLLYIKLLAEGGPVDLEFDWDLIQLSDDSVIASGSWAFGDTFAAMKTAIDTAVGDDITFYSAGPFPANEVVIHLNEPFGEDRYDLYVTVTTITPDTDAWAYFKAARCFKPYP